MKKYEIMVITKASLDEASQKELASTLENVLVKEGATITKNEVMGQREFAYEIDHMKHGFYYLYNIETNNAELVKEFTRVCNINEDVVRHLIINLEK